MLTKLFQLFKDQIYADKRQKQGLYSSESSVQNNQTGILRCVIDFLMQHPERAEFTRCKDRVQTVYDLSYDLIYAGEYHAVLEVHRMTFAYSSVVKVILLLSGAEGNTERLKRSIFILDMAKMMGQPITHKKDDVSVDLIDATIDLITQELRNEAELPQPPVKKLKLDCTVQQTCEIDVVNNPALDVFWKSYYNLQIPALLTSTIAHWPALTKWPDMDYLARVASQRTVPIELGQNYVHENWSQKLVKFEDFLQRYILEPESGATVGYLAQHELFDQIPELKNDICVPEYCCRGAPPRLKAWLGPKGTVSPLHTDPTHNLLAQVFGTKLVILADPAATENLYAHDHFVLNNTSQVDANDPDFDKHPLAKAVTFKRVILRAGDVLYIPPGWWHYVRSLSPSFSVSFWFD